MCAIMNSINQSIILILCSSSATKGTGKKTNQSKLCVLFIQDKTTVSKHVISPQYEKIYIQITFHLQNVESIWLLWDF